MPGEFVEDDQFQIVFLPPNTTSIIQPIDQGVISKTKKVFRHRMLTEIVTSSGNIQEFYKKYDIKDCIHFLDEAWKCITPRNIRNSWNSIMKSAREGTSEEEDSTDPPEPQLEELITAITGEDLSGDRVAEYLRSCDDAETRDEENAGEGETEGEEENGDRGQTEGEEENGGRGQTEGEEKNGGGGQTEGEEENGGGGQTEGEEENETEGEEEPGTKNIKSAESIKK